MSLDYNNPATWIDAALHVPPLFDVKGFQKEINKIVSPTIEGWETVRLVWAPSFQQCYTRQYSDWSKISGLGTESELRARYKFAELKVNGMTFDVPPPRWILEERNDLGQVGEAWEVSRWSKDGREMFPPLPPWGYYSPLANLVDHGNGQCCKNLEKPIVCWGNYREPNAEDLENLRQAAFDREKDIAVNVRAPLSDKVLASAAYVTNERIARKEAMADQELKDYVDENALELIEAFTGIKLSEKTKKFSIPKNFSRKESGLITPVH